MEVSERSGKGEGTGQGESVVYVSKRHERGAAWDVRLTLIGKSGILIGPIGFDRSVC